MTAIPLLGGIQGSEQGEFASLPPLNLEPVAVETNISKGQLRAAIGAKQLSLGPGVDRGGIVWNGTHYRVMGTSLVKISDTGTILTIGDVGGSDPVSMDYGYDRLGIASGNSQCYYDGNTLVQVTDPDIGQVKDNCWVNGQWFTTDGTHVVAAELTNPLEIKPLKYGSAEEDPDEIIGLIRSRNELNAIGRHTIQPMRYVGGNGFPLAPIRGATIPYGAVGTFAKALFGDSFAFVGSARNEALAVFVAGQGNATRISDRSIEDALAKEPSPLGITVETRTYRSEQRLIVHLSNESWCFMAAATSAAQTPVWCRLGSIQGPYRPRNAVWQNGRYYVGDTQSNAVGVLSEDISSHFGDAVPWEFQTAYIYNEGRGGVVRTLELIGLPGRNPEPATAMMSFTRDGTSWSQERAVSLGKPGQRDYRVQWRPFTKFTNYLGFKFRGQSKALPGFARIEARIDALGK